MNWAKKLLQKDDESFTLPSHDCPRCGGRLIDEGDTVHCDTCNYPEPEDDEDDRIVCDVCGRIIDDDGEYPTCPVCGVALCGNEECANRHITEHHPEWDDEDGDEGEDEDDPPQYCDQCGNVIPDGETWCLDVRDGTEHFCCAECQHERAAEIEAASLCAWCHEKCDQGAIRMGLSLMPFCSTDCLNKFRASTAGAGITIGKNEPPNRCDDCERYGRCDDCPGHPGGVPVDPHDPENVPFVPFHVDSEVDCCFLESDFGKASIPLTATTGWRAARQNGETYYPAFDRTIWFRENGYWKRCHSRW